MCVEFIVSEPLDKEGNPAKSDAKSMYYYWNKKQQATDNEIRVTDLKTKEVIVSMRTKRFKAIKIFNDEPAK